MPHKDPMYQQIADDLRGQIESGELPQGSQLPTELELCDAVQRLTEHHQGRDQAADAAWASSRPGRARARFVTRKIDPFVTVLTADPTLGVGGGDGATYLSQVSAGAPQGTA